MRVPVDDDPALLRCTNGKGRASPSVSIETLDADAAEALGLTWCPTVLRIDEGLCGATYVACDGQQAESGGMRFWVR